MNVIPVVLEGRHVRLEPLQLEHIPALWEAGKDPELWRWTQANVVSLKDMENYVASALTDRALGKALPFVIREKVEGKIVGSTRYGNIEMAHRRLEIGWTWVSPPWQRTPINTECKYLLLSHTFENLGCIRVELKTDALNVKSRNAILRIGAKEEGILRKHSVTATGRVRDTVYYSILDAEWPQVKSRLEEMLSRNNIPAGAIRH